MTDVQTDRRRGQLGQASLELAGLLALVAVLITAVLSSGLVGTVTSRLTCAVHEIVGISGGDCSGGGGSGGDGSGVAALGGGPQAQADTVRPNERPVDGGSSRRPSTSNPVEQLGSELLDGGQPRRVTGLTPAEYEQLQLSFEDTTQYAAKTNNETLYQRANAAEQALLQAAKRTPGLLAAIYRYLQSGGLKKIYSGGLDTAAGALDTGQVDYASTPLSRLAYAYRKAQGLNSGRNVAVFEYETPDGPKTLAVASQRGVGHAERLAWQELSSKGVKPSEVTAIYSELQPCNAPGGYCAPWIERTFPRARVSWSFEYGDTQGSRLAGVEELQKTLGELDSQGAWEDR